MAGTDARAFCTALTTVRCLVLFGELDREAPQRGQNIATISSARRQAKSHRTGVRRRHRLSALVPGNWQQGKRRPRSSRQHGHVPISQGGRGKARKGVKMTAAWLRSGGWFEFFGTARMEAGERGGFGISCRERAEHSSSCTCRHACASMVQTNTEAGPMDQMSD